MNELPKRVHLLGVSGAGMLPLAICLSQAGFETSGEDDAMSEQARYWLEKSDVALRALERAEGHHWIVHSSAISEDHPVIREARQRDFVVLRRGECLALLAREKRLLAIGGSHGKTTACGMAIDIFRQSGEEPCFAMGGLFGDNSPPGAWNESDWLIAEVDESDGTIEEFDPEIAIIVNADWDHHSRYSSEGAYFETFKRLANRTRSRTIAHRSLEGILSGSSDSIVYPSAEEVEAIDSNASGDFNRENAALALRAILETSRRLDPATYFEFSRIERRQGISFRSPTTIVVEDYAHHPREIEALAGLLKTVEAKRSIAVFQPHRYSRTRYLKDELAEALARFDSVYLLDVYAASESPLEGGSGKDLHEACQSRVERCLFFETNESLLRTLGNEVDGVGHCLIAFIGAGVTNELAAIYADHLASQDPRWGRFDREVGRHSSLRSKIRANEPLANKTTLRVGGTAERYLEPSSVSELQAALLVCKEEGIAVYPLGRGSNLIVPDSGVQGLVVRLSQSYWRRIKRMGDDRLRVGAGLRIKELCGQACREGLEGFEFLEGIPGSVGGALRMNAGAMGGWMFDVVESVRFLTMDGVVIEAKPDELEVGYRHCRELESAIALDAVLKPTSIGASEAALRKAIDVYQSKRKESQPREPSAGCIFKNPEDDSAGRLVEELGLKGTAIGGAEISETHGNFIVNRGGATSSDVIELVRLARREAKRRRSIDLEPEALLYGSSWKEVLS